MLMDSIVCSAFVLLAYWLGRVHERRKWERS